MLRYTKNAEVNAPKQKHIIPNPANIVGRNNSNIFDRSMSVSCLHKERHVYDEEVCHPIKTVHKDKRMSSGCLGDKATLVCEGKSMVGLV